MIELILRAGNESANPLETAMLLNSLSGVLMCLFFSILTVVVAVIYIKKKNANSGQNKHS